MVLGGLSNTDDSLVLASTEIYDSVQNAWKFGPDFPTPIYGTQVVQYNSDTILASNGAQSLGGGASNKIYALSKSNMASWELIGITTESRYAHISLLIPKTFLDSCNSTRTIEHVDFNFDYEFGDKNEDDITTEEFTTTEEIYTTEETNATWSSLGMAELCLLEILLNSKIVNLTDLAWSMNKKSCSSPNIQSNFENL